jgi:tetratricopeptide (TPR) repeat protein
MLAAPVALGGCGVKVLGVRMPMVTVGAAARTPSAPSQGKLEEAREQASLAPREPFWPYRVGELYLAADSTAKAEAALEAALTRDPSYAPAQALLSKLDYQAGRHEQAIARLEDERARSGGLPASLMAGLALHYEALGRTEQAERAIEETARSARGEERSAVVYMTLRGAQPDSASELAAATVRESPRSAVSQNNYGVTRLRAGDVEAARRAFLEAIELDARLPGPYYNLAILEKYYVFDETAATRWFRLYWERSNDDPDGLVEVFGKPEPKKLADQRSEP